MMDKRRIILLALLHRRRRKKKHLRSSNRRYWVHPLLRVRYVEGAFYLIFEELRQHEDKFFNYFRMRISTFDYLLGRLRSSIRRQDTLMRNCIQPTEMLALTLRYLASGNTFTDLHYTYRIGISTISDIIRDVCVKIWQILKDECIPKPSREYWLNISKEYAERAHFPHCIGAVDGKHVRVCKFKGSGSMNLNYKHFFSIILMAVADANYRFVYVDIGAYGKDCDSSVFRETVFWKMLEEGKLAIHPPTPLDGAKIIDLPYILLGDEAFALSANILRPFGGHNLDVPKRVFNYRLSRARRYVECAFGIFSNKWRIFHRPLNVSKNFAKDIVKACVILHNLVRDRDGCTSDDFYVAKGFTDLPVTRTIRGGRRANDIRECFTNYFLSPNGSLPSQMSKI